MSDLDILEAQVESDRANLARSLDDLASTLSPERLASQVNATVGGYGGEITRMAVDTAKANPAAFALVGAGLALMLTGPGASAPRSPRTSAVPPKTAMDGFDARVADADATMKSAMTGTVERPSASRLRAAMNKGLDALPDAAQKRVLKARRAALEAQEDLERRAKHLASDAKGFHSDRPLVTGALALAFGAALGALIPGTRKENELLGQKRDHLMREAQNALNAEIQALSQTASEKIAPQRAANR